MNQLKHNLAAYAAGLLFGVGLVFGGMTQPAKVVGFLDVFGHWDPSLMFVMGGALSIFALAFRLSNRRAQPLFARSFSTPIKFEIDGRLVAGAAIFGAGWGLAGFCPGPAVVSLVGGSREAFILTPSMVVGMYLFALVAARLEAARQRQLSDAELAGAAERS